MLKVLKTILLLILMLDFLKDKITRYFHVQAYRKKMKSNQVKIATTFSKVNIKTS